VRRVPLAVGAVALAGLLLTACGPGSPTLPSTPDGDDPTTPVEQDDDTGLVQTEVPSTFPRDDVPLVESGEVLFAVDLGTGWTVIFASDDPLADFATAREELVGAGFTVATEDAGDEAAFGQFQSAEYTINISAGEDPTYGAALSYTVVLN
jgi:hypothetical protein